jgi:hypothetical protein
MTLLAVTETEDSRNLMDRYCNHLRIYAHVSCYVHFLHTTCSCGGSNNTVLSIYVYAAHIFVIYSS